MRGSRGGSGSEGWARRGVLVAAFVAAGLVVAAGSAEAQCAFAPTNDTALDAEQGLPLAYSGKLGLFNLYWASDWDANPANFKRADIEKAMTTVLGSTYFDRMCQYGVPGFQFDGAAQAAGVCGSNPGPVTSTPGVLSFASCEEYTPFTGVPQAGGVPNPVTCALCGGLPIDCFNVVEPLCLATPNPTGNHIYIVFLPKGTTINDFGRTSCTGYNAFHMQVPSRALFFPLPPFVAPGTQGRPLNVVIMPTDCFSSVAELMAGVTHEVVEAASDPLPLAHWMDESTGTRGNRLDPSRIETLLTEGEISDACHSATVSFTGPDGTAVELAEYWSNSDNACVANGLPPASSGPTCAASGPAGLLPLAVGLLGLAAWRRRPGTPRETRPRRPRALQGARPAGTPTQAARV